MQDESKAETSETPAGGASELGEVAGGEQKLPLPEEQCVMAALSYLSFLCFIPLLMPGTNEYVVFHLRQGIILFMIGVIASAFAWISMALWLVANLLVAAVSVYGFIQALLARRWVMPVLGEYAKKLKI